MGKIQAWWGAVHTFFDEVRVELKKCSWPSQGELKESTLVVIFSVVLLSAFVGFSDLVLNGILKMIIR
jgi:preprotein translocase SecE subunit